MNITRIVFDQHFNNMTKEEDAKKELNAANQTAYYLIKVIDFIQSLNSDLQRHEATLIAAAYLKTFPAFIQAHPHLLKDMKQEIEQTIKRRNK